MGSPVALGIDVGTTRVKAGAFDPDGNRLGAAAVATPWTVQEARAEIDPERLVDTAIAVAISALAESGAARAVAVGVTGMAETGVLVNDAGDPVAPAIAWFDERGAHQAELLEKAFGAEFTATTGLPPTNLCSLAKLRWLVDHNYATGHERRWYSVAEWIVHRLGGNPGSELSLASRTGLLHLHKAAAHDEAAEWAGFSHPLLSNPTWAGEPAGIASGGPNELAGARVTVAGMDHHCAAYGVGATDPTEVFDSCGTAEAIVRSSRHALTPEEVTRSVAAGITVGWHVVPEHLALLGGLPCGLLLEPVLDLLGTRTRSEIETLSQDALVAEAASPTSPSVGLAEDKTVTITSIRSGTTPEVIWRAALDTVVAAGERTVGTIDAILGPTTRITAAGGWLRNEAFHALKTASLGRRFTVAAEEESGTAGAAKLAWEATEKTP